MSFRERFKAVIAEKQKDAEPAPRALGEIEIPAARNGLLNWLYGNKVVSASPFSGHLSDKLFCARLLEEVLPGCKLLPRSCAIGELASTPAGRHAQFPRGFVVKPTGAMDSGGQGQFLNGEDFFSAPPVVPPGEAVNPITGLVSSGEWYFAQENLGAREREYRLHTLETDVVEGATFTRWDQEWDLAAFARAEAAVTEFLRELPTWITARQAWSVDLMEKEDGSFGIVEINTNRGLEKQWSGDMTNPDTLQAYALHLEAHYGARFLGESGELFRNAQANLMRYEEKFDAEARARHAELKARYRPSITKR